MFEVTTDGKHWIGTNTTTGEIEITGYSLREIEDYIIRHNILPYKIDYRPCGCNIGPQ